MNLDDWRPVLSRWAEQPEHQARVAEADGLILSALRRARQPYVAFSGGKDSTCVLDLVLGQAPGVMVLHWDYGRHYIPRWLYEEFLANARALGVESLRVETSPEYEQLGRRAVNVLGREYMGKLMPRLREEGYDLAFVGLRREESLKRRRRIARRESLTAIPECWPVQNWTWQDVWTYIFARNLPYPSIYDRYVPVVGIERARLCTFFDPEFQHLGTTSLDGVLMWRDRHGSK